MTKQELDGLRDKCGVVGIYSPYECAKRVYLSLHALQHRGQDSAGIVSCKKGELIQEVARGLVSEVFNAHNLMRLKGNMAIGHVRYTTSGTTKLCDAQPIVRKTGKGSIAVAHNGNLVNADFLRDKLESEGAIFQGDSDTEVICHLFSNSTQKNIISCLQDALEKVKGAYSLCILLDNNLIGIRDVHGIRPLFLGRVSNGYVLASEDCCFSLINAEPIREIEPGEIVVINGRGLNSYSLIDKGHKRVSPCVFEHIYFARPDSHVFHGSVYKTRKNLGRELAREAPVEADVVIAVPDSGVLAAMGFAEESKIPYDIGLVRNHYVGRTFIEPEDRIRHFGVRLKLSPVREVVKNKRLVVVDDSIVRGTTSKKIVDLLKRFGAKEIHMRISAPMTTHPCIYGIATPTREELIAAKKSLKEIKTHLAVDSIEYLSYEGLYKALNHRTIRTNMCDACFSGNYPV